MACATVSLQVDATRPGRALRQPRRLLSPMLAAQGSAPAETARLQPGQLVPAAGTALVEPTQSSIRVEPGAHPAGSAAHLLLPAGGLVEVVAILGVQPPRDTCARVQTPAPPEAPVRIKGSRLEVAGEVAVEQRGLAGGARLSWRWAGRSPNSRAQSNAATCCWMGARAAGKPLPWVHRRRRSGWGPGYPWRETGAWRWAPGGWAGYPLWPGC